MDKEEYTGDGHQTRLSPEGRALAADMLKDVTNALAIEDAISRAPRSKPDAGDRTWKIGAHVGKMCRQLVFWEGKGEDPDYRVHKTAREWEAEAGLTRKQLRTATRIAVEEGLLEVELDYRSDGRMTNYYRLNMWEATRKVVDSELDNTNRRLERERRKHQRDSLNRKRRKLERTRDDLNLLAQRDSGNPQPEVDDSQIGQGGLPNCTPTPAKLDPLQESTAGEDTGDYSLQECSAPQIQEFQEPSPPTAGAATPDNDMTAANDTQQQRTAREEGSGPPPSNVTPLVADRARVALARDAMRGLFGDWPGYRGYADEGEWSKLGATLVQLGYADERYSAAELALAARNLERSPQRAVV